MIPPRVVLDANAVGIHQPMRTLDHRITLDAHRDGKIVLVVPELSLVEALHHWRRELRNECDRIRQAHEVLRRRLPIVPAPPPLPDVSELATLAEADLRSGLASAGVVIPPLPDVPHERLVDRALHRARPFDDNGGGYRDALLWEVVVEQARLGTEVILVSGDRRAFWETPKECALAGQLEREVIKRVGGSVRLIGDVSGVVAELGLSQPEALRAATALVATGSSARENLIELVSDLLPGHGIAPFAAREIVDPFIKPLEISVDDVDRVLSVSVVEARRTPEGLLEAELALRTVGLADVTVPEDQTHHVRGSDGLFFGTDARWSTLVSAELVARCAATLDPADGRVIDLHDLDVVEARPFDAEAEVGSPA